jgi:hypothetical protein
MKKEFDDDVEVEEICVELFKVSNRLKLLAELSRETVPYPGACQLLLDISSDIRVVGNDFLEMA